MLRDLAIEIKGLNFTFLVESQKYQEEKKKIDQLSEDNQEGVQDVVVIANYANNVKRWIEF